jgi:hypothetical protein
MVFAIFFDGCGSCRTTTTVGSMNEIGTHFSVVDNCYRFFAKINSGRFGVKKTG